MAVWFITVSVERVVRWERVVVFRPFRVIWGEGVPSAAEGRVIRMESMVRRVSAVRSRI